MVSRLLGGSIRHDVRLHVQPLPVPEQCDSQNRLSNGGGREKYGASTWYILRRVVLPVLKPTIYALTILTFLTGLVATSAPLILGGKEFQTITPMILTFSRSMTSRDFAAGPYSRSGHTGVVDCDDPIRT